jgi:hypothetical protein
LGKVYYNLTELIDEAKNKDIGTSLAVFKPTEIVDFYAESVERNWDKDKLDKLNQLNLFESEKEGKFEVVQKLLYKFKFHFKDNQGTNSHMLPPMLLRRFTFQTDPIKIKKRKFEPN